MRSARAGLALNAGAGSRRSSITMRILRRVSWLRERNERQWEKTSTGERAGLSGAVTVFRSVRYFWLACRRPPELRMLRAKSRQRKQRRRIQPAHRASRQGPRQVPPLLRDEI